MARYNDRIAPENEGRSPARSFLSALDNYYQPARDRRGEQALQRGLNDLSSVLAEGANQAREDRRQAEYSQGVQDAMREQAGLELQGVKTGSIFRQNSRYYMAGLNETRGKALAARFKAETLQAYEQWDGRHTDDDGSAFRAWMAERQAEFIDSLGDNAHVVDGALPVINEVGLRIAETHTAFTNTRLEQESYAAYDEIVAGIFNDMAGGEFTITTDDGREVTDWDAISKRISAEADDMYISDGAAANDRVVDAAIRWANIHNDPDSLLALARAHDSGDFKLSLANREKIADAMDAVEADIAREEARKSAEDTAAEEQARNQHLAEWGAVLEANPYAPLPTFDEVGNDYKTYQQMSTMAEIARKSAETKNPTITTAQRLQFELDMSLATTGAEKLKVLQDFALNNPTALSSSDLAKYTREAIEASNPSSIINNGTVKEFRSTFTESLGQLAAGGAFDLNKVPALKTQGERHFNEYLLAKAGSVDLNDPEAVWNLVQEAEAYAYKRLEAGPMGAILREKVSADETGIAEASGATDAIAAADAANAQAALEEFTRIANDGLAAAFAQGGAGAEAPQEYLTPEQIEAQQAAEEEAARAAEEAAAEEAANQPPEITDNRPRPAIVDPDNNAWKQVMPAPEPNTPEWEDALDDEDTPFSDPDAEATYDGDSVRGTFYAEMIHRFTDGEDTRKDRGAPLRTAMMAVQDDTEFNDGVTRLAEKYGIRRDDLLAVMNFETGGSYDPAVRNKVSRATGLIQFMPKTAASLGTSIEELAKMSRAEQLVYVEKYLDQFPALRGGDLDDVYMAVLWPAAVGKPDGYPIFKAGTIAYKQNAGLDTNGDGQVTKFEAAAKVRKRFYGY